MKKILTVLMFIVIALAGCSSKPAYKATLIEFMDKGCPGCEALKPDIEALKIKFKGLVDFQIYDIRTEAGNEKTGIYGLKGTPTLIFLDENGMEYFRLEKTMQRDVIEALLMTKTGPLPIKK